MAKRRGADLGADEVLAGAVKASAADLVRLIHLENPTGRELGARETAARYARKARLQSLLVRRFASELDVALDSAHPGTVSLRLRSHGRDGCHAVLASLDDDARSWVRRELDLAASAPEPAKSDSVHSRGRGAAPIREQVLDGSTPEALMRRAQVALDAYDYEEARTVLEAALVASRGGAEPAAALLALLVETLGDDGSALAIAEKIDAAVHAETKVRLPLALAAARSGDEARALTWIRGLDDPRSAEIFAALAASALSAGDLDRATAHVERGKRIDPSGAALANVAGEVARARAQARARYRRGRRRSDARRAFDRR
ncbi:MAG: tetratricopeptide repeat protein [Polyangiales bacterium]